MSDAIKCFVDDNFVYQQDSAPDIQCSSTAAVENFQLPFTCTMAPQQSRAELHCPEYLQD